MPRTKPLPAEAADPGGLVPPAWRRAEVRFPVLFMAWAFVLWSLAQKLLLPHGIQAMQAGTGQLVVGGSFLVGLQAQATPEAIVSFAQGAFSYQITEACTAWAPALLFVSAVLAYPARWAQRGAGILIGLPLVFALNVVRLVSMGWIGLHWPSLFEQVHGFWWQAFIILAIGLGWLAWARHVEAERRGLASQGRIRDASLAVAIFLAAMTSLELVGVWTGAMKAYGEVSMSAVNGWVGVFGAIGRFAPDDYSSALFYGGLCGTVALYLATLRVPLRKRVLGALALGVPTQFFLAPFFWALYRVMNLHATSVDDMNLVGEILGKGTSVVLWYLWARRHWAPAPLTSRSYPCPACGIQTTDLLGHIRADHADDPRRWRRLALKAHPHLRSGRSSQEED